MDCPRCGAQLARLSLGDRRSVYCEECRFADVESDHTRRSDSEETWDDAIRRFRKAHADETGDGGDPVEVVDGIAPACAGRLDAAGITTLEDLADADPAVVADAIDVSEPTVTDWIGRARAALADDG